MGWKMKISNKINYIPNSLLGEIYQTHKNHIDTCPYKRPYEKIFNRYHYEYSEDKIIHEEIPVVMEIKCCHPDKRNKILSERFFKHSVNTCAPPFISCPLIYHIYKHEPLEDVNQYGIKR